MRYRITAPVPHVVSTIAGVAFHDSVGETDSLAALSYFQRHGYKVEELADTEAEKKLTKAEEAKEAKAAAAAEKKAADEAAKKAAEEEAAAKAAAEALAKGANK